MSRRVTWADRIFQPLLAEVDRLTAERDELRGEVSRLAGRIQSIATDRDDWKASALAERGHTKRWIAHAHKAEAEVERLTAEVDHWRDRFYRMRETYRVRFNEGLSSEGWHRKHCAAFERGKRAEAREADLRQRVRALADELHRLETKRAWDFKTACERKAHNTAYYVGQEDAYEYAAHRLRDLLDTNISRSVDHPEGVGAAGHQPTDERNDQ